MKRFNTVHLFLAYELHNIRGSFRSIASDVYSVGYNIDSIAKSLKSHQMTLLAVDMTSKSPEERPHLRRCISALIKMIHRNESILEFGSPAVLIPS